jgi:hypothetical protein
MSPSNLQEIEQAGESLFKSVHGVVASINSSSLVDCISNATEGSPLVYSADQLDFDGS